MRLVIVDIDGTLVTGLSTEKRFYLHLLRTGNQGPRQVLAFLGFLIRWGMVYGRNTFKRNKAYLTGLKTEKIRHLAVAWAEAHLEGALFVPCVERIRRYQLEGDEVVLVSGTPDFVADAIAKKLGVDRAIGSRCVERRGRFRLRPPERHPFGHSKIEVAEELRAELGLGWNRVVALGDSIYDLPLLERVGHPIAVRPDERLAAVASSRGWEVIDERDRRGFTIVRGSSSGSG